MLTPIEIQGITFKAGRGYKKEDVDSFMKALYHDYEIMYKENKELKDKVSTLSDGVQYYKNLEKTLQKALVLAEKTSEETKEAAKKQADVLEEEARMKAKQILFEARQEYSKIEAMTHELMQNFEVYKAQFRQIASTQLELLESESFEIHQKTFDFGLEDNLDDKKEVVTDVKQAINIDEEDVKAEYKEDEFFVNLDGIMEEEELDKSTSAQDNMATTVSKEVKQENASASKDMMEEENMDTQTDLEIKMLQKLLKEIKKSNEDEFEFINTED